MFNLKYVVLLWYYLCSVQFIWGDIKLVNSDFGEHHCDSDKVKILDSKFYNKDCGGENALPTFEWLDKNKGTKSYVITLTSMNNSTKVVHFIAWNIPRHINLINNFTNFEEMNAVVGLNSFKKRSYEGPCSTNELQEQSTECLKFSIYALKNERIELSDDADYFELIAYLKRMSREEHIVIDNLYLYSLCIPKKKIHI
ncbi:phosphatidylethanolamine-binding protein, putative [Plasmodium sp. gorilla clade G1]|nr:phosphatidylethanolamine-binding protein, putative [Plasmodium sp. gorilla clade G1]